MTVAPAVQKLFNKPTLTLNEDYTWPSCPPPVWPVRPVLQTKETTARRIQ